MLSSAISSSQNVPLSLFADPNFCRDLAADPIKTLAAHGIKVQPNDLPKEIRLPEFGDLVGRSADPAYWNDADASNTHPRPASIPWLPFLG